MSQERPLGPGTVYTETIVHSPPEMYAKDAPYQLIIVSLDSGHRVTGRVEGDRVKIDDRVDFLELKSGVPYFRKRT